MELSHRRQWKIRETQAWRKLVTEASIFISNETLLKEQNVLLGNTFREITRRFARWRKGKYKETVFEADINCCESISRNEKLLDISRNCKTRRMLSLPRDFAYRTWNLLFSRIESNARFSVLITIVCLLFRLHPFIVF